MPDLLAMLAASLSSASVGYLCGLIVGRDTRSTVVLLRETASQALASITVAPSCTGPDDDPVFDGINGDEPQVVTPAARRGSAWGSSPRFTNLSQDPLPANGPLYAMKVAGLKEWVYCTEARELGDGRLWQRASYFHGKEVYEYTLEPGEWMRCR